MADKFDFSSPQVQQVLREVFFDVLGGAEVFGDVADYFEGRKTLGEIAREYDISVSAARKRAERVRSVLKRYGIFPAKWEAARTKARERYARKGMKREDCAP
ncbi:MAG TPA: hypothetical protein VH253_10910 [Phycisphaerae bacterium]|nr:hypothetical protein [Phycisphaerae bacterium]